MVRSIALTNTPTSWTQIHDVSRWRPKLTKTGTAVYAPQKPLAAPFRISAFRGDVPVEVTKFVIGHYAIR